MKKIIPLILVVILVFPPVGTVVAETWTMDEAAVESLAIEGQEVTESNENPAVSEDNVEIASETSLVPEIEENTPENPPENPTEQGSNEEEDTSESTNVQEIGEGEDPDGTIENPSTEEATEELGIPEITTLNMFEDTSYVSTELDLRVALMDTKPNIELQNDIYLTHDTPLSVSYMGNYNIYSATGDPITIYQTVSDVRHLSFVGGARAVLYFTDVILSGNNVGGGISVDNGYVIIDGVEIMNCYSSTNGGAIYVGYGDYTENTLWLGNSVVTLCSAANNGGAAYVVEGDLQVCNVLFDNNIALSGDGGGVYIERGRLYLSGSMPLQPHYDTMDKIVYENNSVHFNYNSAPNGNGGAVFEWWAPDALDWGIFWHTGSKLYFTGNSASQPYWMGREPDQSYTYNGVSVRDYMIWYFESSHGNDVSKNVMSLSAPPSGNVPFTITYNNYDVAYVGTVQATSNPIVVAFSSSTQANALFFNAVVSQSVQSVPPLGGIPTITVYNNSKVYWQLKVAYDIFTVNGAPDSSLKLDLRGTDGTYTTMEAGLPYTAYTATQSNIALQEFTVPWLVDGNHMLQLRVPANSNNLVNASISTRVYWSLEITP